MWIALNWSLAALALAAWTGLCLALQALVHLLDGLHGSPTAWLAALERWQIPLWLADWLPMAAVTALKSWLTEWIAAIGPWLDIAAASWPAVLGEWLVPLLWLLWGAGAVFLLGAGLIGHLLVRAIRGSGRPHGTPGPAQGSAA